MSKTLIDSTTKKTSQDVDIGIDMPMRHSLPFGTVKGRARHVRIIFLGLASQAASNCTLSEKNVLRGIPQRTRARTAKLIVGETFPPPTPPHGARYVAWFSFWKFLVAPPEQAWETLVNKSSKTPDPPSWYQARVKQKPVLSSACSLQALDICRRKNKKGTEMQHRQLWK